MPAFETDTQKTSLKCRERCHGKKPRRISCAFLNVSFSRVQATKPICQSVCPSVSTSETTLSTQNMAIGLSQTGLLTNSLNLCFHETLVFYILLHFQFSPQIVVVAVILNNQYLHKKRDSKNEIKNLLALFKKVIMKALFSKKIR